MKNELTKLTKKQIKKIAKMAAASKKESAIEVGQRIHSHFEQLLNKMTKDAEESMSKIPYLITGNGIRRVEEINPQPQPSGFRLNKQYGFVSNCLVNSSVTPDEAREIYERYMLEC